VVWFDCAVNQIGRESLKKCTSLDSVKTTSDHGRLQNNMEPGMYQVSVARTNTQGDWPNCRFKCYHLFI